MTICTEIAGLNNASVRGLLEGIVPGDLLNLDNSTAILALEEEQDNVLGFLVFRAEKDCMLITALYVYEEYRRQGVATHILDSFGMMMWVENYHYPILMYIPNEEECLPLLTLMEGRFDYDITVANGCVVATYEEIQESASLHRIVSGKKKDLPSLFDIPLSVRRAEYLDKNIYTYIGDGLISNGQEFCKELCFCDYEDKKLRGFILVRFEGENTLNLEYMYSSNVVSTGYLLANLGDKILKDYRGFSLSVSATTEMAQKLVAELLDNKKEYSQFRASWNGLVWSEIEELILF